MYSYNKNILIQCTRHERERNCTITYLQVLSLQVLYEYVRSIRMYIQYVCTSTPLPEHLHSVLIWSTVVYMYSYVSNTRLRVVHKVLRV